MTDSHEPDDEPNEDEPNEDEQAGAQAGGDGELKPPPAYVYAAGHAALVAPILTAWASDTDLSDTFDLSALAESSEVKAVLVDEALRRELVAIGLYRLRVPRGDKDWDAGGRLEPLDDPEHGWHIVCPIRATSADVRRLWEELSAMVTEPVVTARLHDLTFSARHGDVGDHGTAAVGAYLLWSTTTLDPLHVSEGLARAWTLARIMSNEQLVHAVYQTAHDYARLKLDTDSNPGTVFPLLEILATRARKGPSPIDRATVAGLLADAHSKFGASYLQVRIAGLMRRIAVDDTERAAADRAEVQAHLDDAGRSTGAVKIIHLQRGAQAARDLGVKDLETEAVSSMQAMPADELDLKLQRVSIEMPAFVVASVLRPFDEADDWRGALHQFLHTGCPSGSYDDNVKSSEQSMRGSLLGIFPTVRIGTHGLPERSASSLDDELDMQVTRHESMSSDNWGRWYATGLERMASTYGIPATDEIVAFLMDTYACDEGMATGFATALRLIWQHEYTASVHLSVPRVEQGARRLLLLLNEPLYRVEKGKVPGQFPGLGALLPLLVAEGFDRDWERFLAALLLGRGHNLRNLLAHGFVDGISPGHAALALRAAGLMTLVAPLSDDAVDPQTIRRNLGDPLVMADAYRRIHPFTAWCRRAMRILRSRV